MESVTKLMTKINCVVRFPDGSTLSAPKEVKLALKDFEEMFLKENAREYGMICHDHDFNDDGSRKILHAHLVFTLKKRVRKATLINRISGFFDVNKPSVVIESYSSFVGSFQYLIHYHDPDKAQYDPSEIVSNFSEDEIASIMEEKSSSLPDFDALYAIVQNAPMLQDVIKNLGIGVYQRYRATILDLWRLTHGERTI